MSDINELTKTVESVNFLDAITNVIYNVYLGIKYNWYFNILGYSKDKYLTDVADPVYDGLRDKGYLDKINTDKYGVSATSTSVGTAYLDSFNSYNPLTNGTYNLSGNSISETLPIGNSTNTTELLTGEQGENASMVDKDGNPLANMSTTSNYLLDAAAKLGLDNTRDSDGDGIPDIIDPHPNDAENMTGAELNSLFSSEYGASDKLRMAFGLGPKDTDGDGIPDVYEDKIGTSPLSSDSDMDGVSDFQELIEGTDPNNPDTDGDGVLDGRDQQSLNKFISVNHGVFDTDHDGAADIIEKYLGGNIYSTDTDGDGISDGMDIIINGDNDTAVKYNSGYKYTTLNFDTAGWLEKHMHIENGILSFATDIVSLMFILVLIFFASSFSKWWFAMKKSIAHYEHTFNPHDTHGHVAHESEDPPEHTLLAGSDGGGDVDGLPVEWFPEDHNITAEYRHGDTITLDEVKKTTDEILHPYRNKWQIVQNYMNDELEVMWRLGIIEADNLLFEVLRSKGYRGESLGDMMKDANFRSIDQAWDAHKIRNRIAHEGSAYHLTDREARRVFTIYEEVLKELKAI